MPHHFQSNRIQNIGGVNQTRAKASEADAKPSTLLKVFIYIAFPQMSLLGGSLKFAYIGVIYSENFFFSMLAGIREFALCVLTSWNLHIRYSKCSSFPMTHFFRFVFEKRKFFRRGNNYGRKMWVPGMATNHRYSHGLKVAQGSIWNSHKSPFEILFHHFESAHIVRDSKVKIFVQNSLNSIFYRHTIRSNAWR